jgi:hypothetical protein
MTEQPVDAKLHKAKADVLVAHGSRGPVELERVKAILWQRCIESAARMAVRAKEV